MITQLQSNVWQIKDLLLLSKINMHLFI